MCLTGIAAGRHARIRRGRGPVCILDSGLMKSGGGYHCVPVRVWVDWIKAAPTRRAGTSIDFEILERLRPTEW